MLIQNPYPLQIFSWLYLPYRHMLQKILYICAQIQGNIYNLSPFRRPASQMGEYVIFRWPYYKLHIFLGPATGILGPNGIRIDKSRNNVNDKEAISYIQFI